MADVTVVELGTPGPAGPAGATGATGAAGSPGSNGINAQMTRDSTTSFTIGTGSKVFSFTVAFTNGGWIVGMRIRAASNANVANYMEGQITALDATSVTLNVNQTGGSGTFADWKLGVAGDVGATGSYTAGAGLTLTGSTLDVGAGNGIQVDADSVTVKLDGTTLAKGVNGLKINTDGVTTTELAALAVTTAKLADDSVDSAKLKDDAVTDANRAVTTNHLRDLAVTTAKLADDSVDSMKLKDDATTDANRAVTTNHIRDSAVTEAKLAASVAGTGLTGGGGQPLAVGVGAGLAATANEVSIPTDGIVTSMILAQAVTEAKLHTSVAGAGLTGGNGSPLAVGAGDGIAVAANDVAVKLETDAGLQFDAVNKGLEHKLDGTTLSVSATGLKVASAGITTTELANDSVDATKLKDDATVDGNRAVTTDHIRDLAVTSAKLAASAVTAGKIAVGGISASNQFVAGVVDTAALAADSVDATKLKDDATTDANRAVTTDHVRDLAITSAKLAASAVTAGKIATGGISAAGQFAAGVIDTAAIGNAQVTKAKLASDATNLLTDAKRASAYVTVSSTLTTGTAQPLSLADSLFTGKVAGGAINGNGTDGVVAGSFATAAAETGTAATQAGLGSAAASNQPYNSTDFPGQTDITVLLQKADGDDVLLKDVLSTATGADINARVYGYLSYRSDLGVDLKWRLWFYYRRASDGFETPFTPDTSLTNAALAVPEVFTLNNVPVKSGLGIPIVAGQAAAALGPGSVGTTELASQAVTEAKLNTSVAGGGLTGGNGTALAVGAGDGIQVDPDAVTVKLDGTTLAKSPTGLKIAASGVGSLELAAGAVTAGKIAVGGISASNQFLAGVVDTAALANDAVDATKLKDDATTDANRAVTTDHIRDLAVTSAKLAAAAVTAGKIATGGVSASAQFAAGVVDTAALANDAVDATKLKDDATTDANRAVTTDHIRDLAITNAKLAASAVSDAKIDATGITTRSKLPAALAYEDEANVFTGATQEVKDLVLTDQDATPVGARRLRNIDGIIKATDGTQAEGRYISKASLELLSKTELPAAVAYEDEANVFTGATNEFKDVVFTDQDATPVGARRLRNIDGILKATDGTQTEGRYISKTSLELLTKTELPAAVAYEDEANNFTGAVNEFKDVELNDQDATPIADRRLRTIDGIIKATDTAQAEGRYISRLSLELLTKTELPAAVAYEDESNNFTGTVNEFKDVELNDQDASPVADRRLRTIDGIIQATDTAQAQGRYISRDSVQGPNGDIFKSMNPEEASLFFAAPAVLGTIGTGDDRVRTLDFADGSTLSAEVSFVAPATSVTFRIIWTASVTTGNCRLGVSIKGSGDYTAAYPAPTSVDSAAPGTANNAKNTDFTLSSLTVGNLIKVRIGREGGHANDTMAATANVMMFVVFV